MEIRNNLELVAVEFESEGQKVIFTLLDRERKEVRQVNWNKQVYKDRKFLKDDAKAAQVEEWSQKYFGVEFADLPSRVGTLMDVYIYDKFNSFWAASTISKFDKSQVGEVYQTEVKEVIIDDYAIKIRYEIDGKTYESKHTFGRYLEEMHEWFVDPQKKAAVFEKFEGKYGVPVEQADSLIGHPLMVEVKCAFGSACYGDIKKFPKK